MSGRKRKAMTTEPVKEEEDMVEEEPADTTAAAATAAAADDDDDDDDDDDCTYVVLDVPADVATAEELAALGPEAFDLDRFGTSAPTVKIKDKVLSGTYEPLVASQLVFERPEGAGQRWKLSAVSNKRIALSKDGDGR